MPGIRQERLKTPYREQNRTDLALFEAAGRFFKERGLTKLPSIAKLQEENESLISRKNAAYSEYREQKAKTAELHRVRDNVHKMLDREQEPPQKRHEYER